MKIRKQEYGDFNIVGKKIEMLRREKGIKQKDFIAKMQTMGCNINPTSYSKLEGQIRSATDKEIFVIAKLLGVTMEELTKFIATINSYLADYVLIILLVLLFLVPNGKLASNNFKGRFSKRN